MDIKLTGTHLPHKIIHPLHSQHQLKLQLDGYWDFVCDKCFYISSGSRYNCSSCDFNLDLSCAGPSANYDPLPEEAEWRRKKTIQHYSHYDKLSLFKYRKTKLEADYDCSWCEKRLLDSDVCYGCIEHGFFLHEVCSNKIPRTLVHPFHPLHPLRLHYIDITNYCHACKEIPVSTVSPSYVCQLCSFCLDFGCAKLLPTLKHKGHNHILTFFRKVDTYGQLKHFRCSVCDKICDASFYRCVQCDFNLHLQCLAVSSHAKHKYHKHPLILMDPIKEDDSGEYYCDVCEKERNPNHPVYYCEKCKYIVHIECIFHEENMISSEEVQSSAPQFMDSKEMEHNEWTHDIHSSRQPLYLPLIHEHSLSYSEYGVTGYCHGCRQILSGPRYICRSCPAVYLHEKCVKLRYEIQHPFHSTHPLYLYATRPYGTGYITCDECRDISSGFIYLCEKCNFKLDVKCALTSVSKPKHDRMGRVTESHHFTHPHKLTLGNSSDPIREIECSICELPIKGPAYFCPSCTDYILHESCLGLPQNMLQVPFHPDHMLVMSSKPYSYTEKSHCFACRLDFDRLGDLANYFGYSCDQCDVKLHSICANSLRRSLKHESHLHNLYYFGANSQILFARNRRVPATFQCSKCQDNCKGRPFYRCLQCDINFHLECFPLPLAVESRCHIHPLALKESFIEDHSGEYYCDVCEEERFNNDHVYCCGECNNRFVAHIECVLPKVETVLSYLDPHERKKSPIYEIPDSGPRQRVSRGAPYARIARPRGRGFKSLFMRR
ncbi:hypothetical protein PTKIN_Ptkin01aG0347500 [Pterospermum kingtungense]